MGIQWHKINPADVEGRGWEDTEFLFGRLPPRLKDSVPYAYGQSHTSTGMCFFFRTDSTSIHVRYDMYYEALGEDNFNVTAFTGVDLYAWDPERKNWHWGGATLHGKIHDRHPEYAVIEKMQGKMRMWRMYLPMRNQLLNFSIGVDSEASFELIPPRKTEPIVYYGTSIVHGAYSIRSGLGIAQIIGRNFDRPMINLGFSGAAQLEPEMAESLGELNPAFYILDPYHNVTENLVKERLERFLTILCSARPKTPVFLLTAPEVLLNWLRPPEFHAEAERRGILMKQIVFRLKKQYPNLHFINGKRFYGGDEVSMDGIHPNDAAFANMAEILTSRIRAVISH